MPPASKKEEIIRQAYEVFYREGFQATAIDKLLEDSGISKRTLYKYFPSKEALIAAAIAYYKEQALKKLPEVLASRTDCAIQRILTLFDLKREALEAGRQVGCFAVNAKLEYGNKAQKLEPIQTECKCFFEELEAYVVTMCQTAGSTQPEESARQILVLLEGGMVYAQTKKDPTALTTAKAVAELVLNTARQKT